MKDSSNACVLNVGARRIEVVRGDITKESTDAIVNAANEQLRRGGGVCGAIHRAAGPGLLGECLQLNGCAPGRAKMTRGYNLPAKHVIHAVGPIYQDGDHGEPELLASCYRESLELAAAAKLKSVAFPAISCGVYGYPVAAAAPVALTAIRDALKSDSDSSIDRVRCVMFSGADHEVYCQALRELGAA